MLRGEEDNPEQQRTEIENIERMTIEQLEGRYDSFSLGWLRDAYLPTSLNCLLPSHFGGKPKY